MADDKLVDHLRGIDLFATVGRRPLDRLAHRAKEVRHAQGHTILDEGGRPLGFHLILEGEATIIRDGAEQIRLGPGAYFGEMSLIDGQPRSATVIAQTPLRTAYLDYSAFDAMMAEHPEVAREVMKRLTGRIRDLEARVRELGG
jgi:CRP-like cAMP-binding protein